MPPVTYERKAWPPVQQWSINVAVLIDIMRSYGLIDGGGGVPLWADFVTDVNTSVQNKYHGGAVPIPQIAGAGVAGIGTGTRPSDATIKMFADMEKVVSEAGFKIDRGPSVGSTFKAGIKLDCRHVPSAPMGSPAQWVISAQELIIGASNRTYVNRSIHPASGGVHAATVTAAEPGADALSQRQRARVINPRVAHISGGVSTPGVIQIDQYQRAPAEQRDGSVRQRFPWQDDIEKKPYDDFEPDKRQMLETYCKINNIPLSRVPKMLKQIQKPRPGVTNRPIMAPFTQHADKPGRAFQRVFNKPHVDPMAYPAGPIQTAVARIRLDQMREWENVYNRGKSLNLTEVIDFVQRENKRWDDFSKRFPGQPTHKLVFPAERSPAMKCLRNIQAGIPIDGVLKSMAMGARHVAEHIPWSPLTGARVGKKHERYRAKYGIEAAEFVDKRGRQHTNRLGDRWYHKIGRALTHTHTKRYAAIVGLSATVSFLVWKIINHEAPVATDFSNIYMHLEEVGDYIRDYLQHEPTITTGISETGLDTFTGNAARRIEEVLSGSPEFPHQGVVPRELDLSGDFIDFSGQLEPQTWQQEGVWADEPSAPRDVNDFTWGDEIDELER